MRHQRAVEVYVLPFSLGLIQFVRVLAKPEMVPEGQEAPKRADVVGWSNLIANNIAPGDRNSYVRGHLKAISKSAWDLANWLTHQGGAIRPDAEIAGGAAGADTGFSTWSC